jgi:hypothetical protein
MSGATTSASKVKGRKMDAKRFMEQGRNEARRGGGGGFAVA